MTRTAKVLQYTAFTLMMMVGVAGGLLLAGYAFKDLDPWVATVTTAAWFVPMVAMSVLAVRRPDAAAPVLVGLAVAVGFATVLDAAFSVVDIDALGPVMAVAVLATAVALGFLGLHREALSGLLLILLALAQFGATVLAHAGSGRSGGPGMRDLLTTSSGITVLPLALVGLLLLVAGALDHEPPGLRHVGPTARTAH